MMDKNKVLRDIAQIQQQIFALTTVTGFLLVTTATILSQGFAPYIIFRNAVLGLLGFGILGYIWGRIYGRIVETPLLRSYHEEKKLTSDSEPSPESEKIPLDVDITELTPGMKVLGSVYTPDGALLVREGAVLTERLIQTLMENGISTVRIEAQPAASDEEEM